MRRKSNWSIHSKTTIMFLHVFYSWLITQLLHPILVIALSYVLNGSIDLLEPGFIFLFAIGSVVISSPCLLLGWLSLGLIVYSDHTVVAKFVLWFLATGILVVLNFFILALILYRNFQVELLFMTIPGILSIWISSVIRWKQFQKLVYIENQPVNSYVPFQPKNQEAL